MDSSFARGFATSFIQTLPNHQELIDWMNGKKSTKLLSGLLKSFPSKKPGRVLKRIAPTLVPLFEPPQIVAWKGDRRLITSQCLTSSLETAVLDLGEDEAARAIFNERTIFHNTLVMTWNAAESQAETTILSSANICNHAIRRLLERDYMNAENMHAKTMELLGAVRNIASGLHHAEFGSHKVMSLMLPLGEGALIICTADIRPLSSVQNVQHQTLSVRTYLPPEMITEHKRERMRPLREALGGETYPCADLLGALLKENAQPYSFDRDRIKVMEQESRADAEETGARAAAAPEAATAL